MYVCVCKVYSFLQISTVKMLFVLVDYHNLMEIPLLCHWFPVIVCLILLFTDDIVVNKPSLIYIYKHFVMITSGCKVKDDTRNSACFYDGVF
jgi:hypothetical protein